eukprot:673199-Pyramimonas_sp.AAC.1
MDDHAHRNDFTDIFGDCPTPGADPPPALATSANAAGVGRASNSAEGPAPEPASRPLPAAPSR